MRYLVLASDYDGTLATDGRVDDSTLFAWRELQRSGRKVILVTGRELDDLKQVFPQIGICELVAAENGGLLYKRKTQEICPLPPGKAPSEDFLPGLKVRGIPFSVGRVIVGTSEPHQAAVLDVIKRLGLELH